ncbi:MAG: glycosyltransferase [Microthrixaceae bacterium]
MARFDPVKGLDVLVDAMTRLVPPEPGESGSTKCGVGGHQSGASPAENAEGPAIELTIFGDGPERPAIEQRIAAAGLGAHVRLGGWVDDVGQRLGAFDVFVLPSRVEGMPVSLLEAMDAGVAVVATDVGSVREVIEDGVSGLVVAPEDPDAIASAVRSLVDDVRRHTLAEAGRDVVRAGHSAEANVAAYEALYDGVLAGPPRRSIRGRVRGRWVRGRR